MADDPSKERTLDAEWRFGRHTERTTVQRGRLWSNDAMSSACQTESNISDTIEVDIRHWMTVR